MSAAESSAARAGGVASPLGGEERPVGRDRGEDRDREPGPAGVDALDGEVRVAGEADLAGELEQVRAARDERDGGEGERGQPEEGHRGLPALRGPLPPWVTDGGSWRS